MENYKGCTTKTSIQCFSPLLKTDMILKKVLGWVWGGSFVWLSGFGWVFVGLGFFLNKGPYVSDFRIFLGCQASDSLCLKV